MSIESKLVNEKHMNVSDTLGGSAYDIFDIPLTAKTSELPGTFVPLYPKEGSNLSNSNSTAYAYEIEKPPGIWAPFLDFYEIKVKVTKADGTTALTAYDSATAATRSAIKNSIHSLFERERLISNGKTIDDITHPGLLDTVEWIQRPKEIVDRQGPDQGFFLDTADTQTCAGIVASMAGGEITITQAKTTDKEVTAITVTGAAPATTDNTGFKARALQCRPTNSSKSYYMKDLFDILRQKRLMFHGTLKFELTRAADSAILDLTAAAVGGDNPKVSIESITKWAFKVYPSPSIRGELGQLITEGASQNIPYKRYSILPKAVAATDTQTIIPSSHAQTPKRVLLFYMPTAGTGSAGASSQRRMYPNDIRSIKISYAGHSYPDQPYVIDNWANSQNYKRAFYDFVLHSGGFDNNGIAITSDQWASLYTIFSFDLSKDPSGLPELEVEPIDMITEINYNTGATAAGVIYSVFIYDYLACISGIESSMINLIGK
jgi:Tfp pilus assembly major pilin PilA